MVKRKRRPINELMKKSSQGSGMICPHCGCIQIGSGKTVTHTRHTSAGTINRRRECRSCGKTFTTIERIVK